MSGKNVTPTISRANRHKQIGAITFGARQDRHFGAGCLTVPAYPFDNLIVSRADYSGKCDQPRENFLHIHWRPLAAGGSGDGSLMARGSFPCRITMPFGRRFRIIALEQRNLLASPCDIAARDVCPALQPRRIKGAWVGVLSKEWIAEMQRSVRLKSFELVAQDIA